MPYVIEFVEDDTVALRRRLDVIQTNKGRIDSVSYQPGRTSVLISGRTYDVPGTKCYVVISEYP